jgi:uncharacterized repeat protein (TIGR01451 family)
VSPDLLIGITGNTARPGMAVNYVIGFGNTTPNIIAAQTVSFTADPSLIFNSAFPTPASIVGNVYTWNTSSFSPFANHYLTLHFTVPATTPLGTTLTNSATISIASGETITSNNTDYLVQTVTGSYDPNEKSVYPTGIGNDGYVTDDQLLRYTIDFQNTGTDTAFNIVVVDTLPAALDKYSLQVLASSHAYTYEFKSGNVVAFHFNNVLLIDSTTNEQASHGYIKFSIAQKPGNAVGTTIDNTAAIYFDYNAPVLTNAVHNTVFNCNAMATPVYSDTVICDGEIISASANLLFPMSSTWYIDNALFASDSSTVLSGFSVGNHTVSLHAENAACSLNISTNVDVYALPVKPTFVQNTGLLTSSSLSDNQWLLNGTLISGATGQTFAAIVSGYYSVMVTNANGCSNVSDSAYITLSGLHSPQGNEAIIVSPNPVNDVLNISNIELQPNAIITICDNLGGIVFEKKIDAACNNFTVSTITFAPGLYLLQIHASKGLLIRKFTKN